MKSAVYLSLGSNLDDRRAHLANAVKKLGELGEIFAVSSLYETEPVEVTGQPWFLNCALGLTTELTPEELIKAVLQIEKELGRERTREKGPRTIDIDILLYADAVISQPGLNIPHPAMHQRRFVLEPLGEIAADVRHPLLKSTVAELLGALAVGPVVSCFGTLLQK